MYLATERQNLSLGRANVLILQPTNRSSIEARIRRQATVTASAPFGLYGILLTAASSDERRKRIVTGDYTLFFTRTKAIF